MPMTTDSGEYTIIDLGWGDGAPSLTTYISPKAEVNKVMLANYYKDIIKECLHHNRVTVTHYLLNKTLG